MKQRLGPCEMLYPMPAVLVAAAHEGELALTTVAWAGIASATPPTVAISLRRSRHVHRLVNASAQFTVNVPSTALARQVDRCGLVSGRDVDKFADAGLTAETAAIVGAPMVAECALNLECVVSQVVEIGEYSLFLGEIVEVHLDDSVINEAGDRPDVTALDPLVYCPTVREYRGVGPKLADAFKIGRSDG